MTLPHDASGTPNSIWTTVREDQFVETIRELLNSSGKVPGQLCIHNLCRAKNFHENPLHPKVEYQLAQDLAFIAAHEEGVHAVSAATVEEARDQQGLTFNIASNSGVKAIVQDYFREIKTCLEQCAQKNIRRSECTESIFHLIVRLCEGRIIGRLKCKDWIAPPYYRRRPGPLHKELKASIDRYSKNNNGCSDQIETLSPKLESFMAFMTRIDRGTLTPSFQTRLEAVRLAGQVCDIRTSLELTLKRACIFLDSSSQKSVKAFDKLANYRHISERLSRMAASSTLRSFFKSISCRFLDPYVGRVVQREERFVHAEVQLVVFHRLQKDHCSLRTIGTSKAACYLCDLFLRHHPQYNISATHGVIFEAWTIPDILSYSSEDRGELRDIIRSMQNTLEARIQVQERNYLPFPVQSGIYYVPSLPSLAGTVIDPAASVSDERLSTAHAKPEDKSVEAFKEIFTVSSMDQRMMSIRERKIEHLSSQPVNVDEDHSENADGELQARVYVFLESKLDSNSEHRGDNESSQDTQPTLGHKSDSDIIDWESAGTLDSISAFSAARGSQNRDKSLSELSQAQKALRIIPERPSPQSKASREKITDTLHSEPIRGSAGPSYLKQYQAAVSATTVSRETTQARNNQDTLGISREEGREPLDKRHRKKRQKRRPKSSYSNVRKETDKSKKKRAGRLEAAQRTRKGKHAHRPRARTIEDRLWFKEIVL